MRVRGGIVIAREPTAVFQFVSNPANDTSWRSYVTAAHLVGEALAVGSRVRQTYTYKDRTVEIDLEIREYEPPERVGFQMHGQLDALIRYACSPESGGTRFNMSMKADIHGPAAMFEGRIQRELDEVIATDLKQLKTVLERQEGA